MMTVNTTIRSAPPVHKRRCERAEPGDGYRLLKAYEVILPTDEVLSETRGWIRNDTGDDCPLNPCWRPRRRKLTAEELYNELLYAVASKWPGETRHQTALRYIREAEGLATVTIATLQTFLGVAKDITNKPEHEGW